MPQGHNRHDMKWNSLQSKRLGMDSRVVDGGVLHDQATPVRVRRERGAGTPTDRVHGGISRRRLDLLSALVNAASRRSKIDRDAPPVQLFDSKGALITIAQLPITERFHFERWGNGVVAVPADVEEKGHPEYCVAQGCELMAGDDGGLCAFHEMQQDDVEAQWKIPLQVDDVGTGRWDGMAAARVRGRLIEPYQWAVFRSVVIEPKPYKPRHAHWRYSLKGKIWVSETGIVSRDLVNEVVAAAPTRIVMDTDQPPLGTHEEWHRFTSVLRHVLSVDVAELKKMPNYKAVAPKKEKRYSIISLSPMSRRRKA